MSIRHINMCMNLQELRVKVGLTQKGLAIRVGCAQSEISRIERGERSISVDRLQQLATALNVPVATLLGERHSVAA
jgi:transcriptional regulator with XRE-family HTH domain